jgi:uncharacterized membrane protein
MTQAEIEAQLASLRSDVDQLRKREKNRDKGWKISLTMVRLTVVLLVIVAVGMFVLALMTNSSVLLAIQILLVAFPLMVLAVTLQADAESGVAKS